MLNNNVMYYESNISEKNNRKKKENSIMSQFQKRRVVHKLINFYAFNSSCGHSVSSAMNFTTLSRLYGLNTSEISVGSLTMNLLLNIIGNN